MCVFVIVAIVDQGCFFLCIRFCLVGEKIEGRRSKRVYREFT